MFFFGFRKFVISTDYLLNNSMIGVNYDYVVQRGSIIIAFQHFFWIFHITVRMVLKGEKINILFQFIVNASRRNGFRCGSQDVYI